MNDKDEDWEKRLVPMKQIKLDGARYAAYTDTRFCDLLFGYGKAHYFIDTQEKFEVVREKIDNS